MRRAELRIKAFARGEGERSRADPVRWHMEGLLKESDPPTDEYRNEKRFRSQVTQVSTPREGHENV